MMFSLLSRQRKPPNSHLSRWNQWISARKLPQVIKIITYYLSVDRLNDNRLILSALHYLLPAISNERCSILPFNLVLFPFISRFLWKLSCRDLTLDNYGKSLSVNYATEISKNGDMHVFFHTLCVFPQRSGWQVRLVAGSLNQIWYLAVWYSHNSIQ